MTDKQIIIDGCNVSGCEYYFDEKCRCMDASIMQDFYSCPQCNSNPNCYYKQLKRKEQECEELKNIINEAKNSKLDLKSFLVGEAIQNEYEQQLDQLKAESENWESLCKHADKQIDELKAEIKKLNHQIEDVDTLCNEKESLIDKYLQTLAEIKEFVKNEMILNDDTYIILQKISEVENETAK